MSAGYAREDLSQFLDYLGNKGLMNPQTASARKASANTLLGILSDDEAKDVTKIDLDAITQRFLNLKGTEYKQDSVRVYKSRVEAAIRDFASYKKDPLGFKPKLEQRTARSPDKKPKETSAVPENNSTNSNFHSPTTIQSEGIVFPIPLRPNLTVKIAGIPSDLSNAEAKKICNIVMALAMQGDI